MRPGQLPKVDIPDSVIDVEAEVVAPPPRPRPVVRSAPARRVNDSNAVDPLRVIGTTTVAMSAVYGLLWALGALMTNGGPAELQQFNAGKPVMLCTAGNYRPTDDSLLGRIFGERHFTCSDWKMGL